ncbi:MAG: transglycosylase SLT domain-containing protein [candidate division NC10 bacterium]
MRSFASALVIGLFLALSGPAAVAGPADGERARFGAAVEALRGGDWREAARGFGVVAKRGGLLADYAQFFLAEALARQGDLAAARRIAEHFPSRHPESLLAPLAVLHAAVWASRQGDEAAVESLLRRYLSQFPAYPETPGARYLLGLSLEAQGRGLDAARAFRELWLTAPASAYGEAAGDRVQALAAAGVRLPPPTQPELMDRAERLLAGGLLSAARQEAEALLVELPDPELTLRGLRVMTGGWRRGGQYDVAQRAADRALADAPVERRPPLLLDLARLQQRAGAREGALATLARLAREHPAALEVPDALLQSGRLLEDTGRPAEAEALYRRLAADFAVRDAAGAALWRLAWLAYLRADLPAAAAEFGRLAALPAGALYRHPATYWAGRVREALGEEAEARRLYGTVVAAAPRGYYGILAAQRTREQPAARGRALTAALPADPFKPLAGDRRFQKAAALSALGLIEFALNELEEIQSRSLAEPSKLYALGAAFVREERYHLALRIFRRHFGELASSGDPALPRAFWEMLYPLAWPREVGEAATRAGVDRFLVAAVAREESNFFPRARSRAGARGLMQLMPDTARGLALRRGLTFGDGDLLDEPAPNLQLGAAYLAALLAEFPDPRLAAAAYNAGPLRVREWWAARRSDDVELFVEQIPFDETRHFVKRVTVSWEEYRRLYGDGTTALGGGR